MSIRNPIAALNEMSQRINVRISYECTSIGDIHKPYFKCECRFGTNTCNAQGSSKKIAKELCANEMLALIQSTKAAVKLGHQHALSTPENYIGMLNEYCAKNRVCADYKLESTTGSYEVICNAKGFETIGKSENKKEAKQIAAMKMLTKLRTVSSVESKMVKVEKSAFIPNDNEIIKQYKNLKLEETNVIKNEKQIQVNRDFTAYDVSELQKDPLILVAKHKVDKKMVYIAAGKNCEEAMMKLSLLTSNF